MNENETRTINESLEVRSDEEKMIVKGYALKFGTWSKNLGGFKETVSRSALENTPLKDVRALFNHDPQKVLGRTTNESLKLYIDDVGLRFECELPNTTYARDLYENLKVGNIDKCSYGFRVAKNGDEVRYDKEEGIYKRTVNKISKLAEISVVSFPAYEDTVASVRSVDKAKDEDFTLKQLSLESYAIKNKYK